MADVTPLKVGSNGEPEQMASGDTIPSSLLSELDLIDGLTSGGALAINDAVYVDAAGKIQKADASDPAKMPAVGFTLDAATGADEANKRVQRSGKLGGFSGFTLGARQFISTSTPGDLQETVASGGDVIQPMGVAVSATELIVSGNMKTIKTSA